VSYSLCLVEHRCVGQSDGSVLRPSRVWSVAGTTVPKGLRGAGPFLGHTLPPLVEGQRCGALVFDLRLETRD